LNIEFFSSTMNDDKIFFKIIMLIFISNNFHLWIEEFKDLALKMKIWKYINSYNQIAKSRKEVLFEIFHFDIRTSVFTFSTIADDFITNQFDSSVHASQSRLAKYFHELSIEQQKNYRANIKEYKRKKKNKSSKSFKKMLKINETIRVLMKLYFFLKLMFVFIKEILQFLIIKYKKIDDQIKK
jgi:hypothetical protein